METPIYRHHCRNCRFLGRYEHAGIQYDLYFCAPTQVVARWGDEAEDQVGFFSWRVPPAEDFPEIVEAISRAKDRQLVA